MRCWPTLGTTPARSDCSTASRSLGLMVAMSLQAPQNGCIHLKRVGGIEARPAEPVERSFVDTLQRSIEHDAAVPGQVFQLGTCPHRACEQDLRETGLFAIQTSERSLGLGDLNRLAGWL